MKEAGTHVPAFHEGAGIRTQDTRLKRAVLYRLSYTLALLIYYTPRDVASQTGGSLSSGKRVRFLATVSYCYCHDTKSEGERVADAV